MKQLNKERKIACANLSHRLTGMVVATTKDFTVLRKDNKESTQLDRIEMHAKLLDTGTIQMLLSNAVKGRRKRCHCSREIAERNQST